MPCTGCAQRRAAIADGIKAIRRADFGQASDRLKIVGRSATDDLKRLRQSALQAARNRLAGR